MKTWIPLDNFVARLEDGDQPTSECSRQRFDQTKLAEGGHSISGCTFSTDYFSPNTPATASSGGL